MSNLINSLQGNNHLLENYLKHKKEMHEQHSFQQLNNKYMQEFAKLISVKFDIKDIQELRKLLDDLCEGRWN